MIAPGQRIDRMQALRCATVHGAWLCLDETDRGSLETGKQADLLVLRDNPLDVELARLSQMEADMTWVGGRQVYPGDNA